MSEGFAKLYSDIVDSSIWDEPPETCKVWVTLLALSDRDGFVRGSLGWLASKSKVTIEQCGKALECFTRPDPKSRTPSNEGRRIKEVERGWLILNYSYFRDEHKQLSSNPRRVYQREWMRKKRQSTGCQQNVNKVNPASASASVSVPVQEGECEGMESKYPEAETPSWEEFWAYSQCIGFTAEWYARDKYLAASQQNWEKQRNWRAYVQRCRTWWEADGRPKEKAKKGGRDGAPAHVRLRAIDNQIQEHPANKQSLNHNAKCTQEQRDELKFLRKERDRIEREIALQKT